MTADDSIDEVEMLSWKLLDEGLNRTDMDRFERRLLGDRTACETYMRCVQLHVDLYAYFGDIRSDRFLPKVDSPQTTASTSSTS